jgi:hypothetical protein
VYPVTQDFLDKMKADRRQVFARVEIDYTDPFIDQSIRIEANEQANISYPQQTADSVDQTTRKYACLDGTWDLTSGEYHLAPSADQLTQQQFGWWGAQFCDQDGYFASPYPTLTVRHLPRPIRQLKVVSDTARGEYPVDFTIKLYAQDDTLLKTETVTGNDQVSWQKALETQVLDVAKQVLEITKWSLPGTCAKIVEFFTSIREVYETGDLVNLRLLEEREASQGSLPVGNISSNEITLALSNADKKFDIDNENSPLKNLLKPNRRIQAWLGLKGGGEGMNIQQNVDFSQGELNNLVVVNNKLQLPDVGSPSFSRNSTAYLSDGALVNTNFPRFEQGKFGKAIMVEEGTTNLIPSQPASVEEDAPTGWENIGQTVHERTTGDAWHGQASIRATNTGESGTSYLTRQVGISSPPVGTLYTASAYVKGVPGTSASIGIGFGGGSEPISWQYAPGTTMNGQWQVVTITRAVEQPDRTRATVSLSMRTAGATYYWDAIQLEAKPYATSFIDGTRSREVLTIPTAGVLNPQEGEISVWAYVTKRFIDGGSWQAFLCNRFTGDEWGFYVARTSNAEKVQFRLRFKTFVQNFDSPISLQEGDWMLITLKWDVDTIKLLFNGVVGIETENIYDVTFADITYIGSHRGYEELANTLFDDLRISNRARSDDEILAAYQSGQPLPVDKWTTYKLGFDGNLNFGQGGYYISPEYDLSAVGTAATSAITWQEDADGVQRTVYAKLDNQSDWTQVQNGGKLPISTGGVLTGRKLQIKTKLIRV